MSRPRRNRTRSGWEQRGITGKEHRTEEADTQPFTQVNAPSSPKCRQLPKLKVGSDCTVRPDHDLVPSAVMADTGGELGWLEQWYQAQCDGDWEHEWGVRIATLDNPGWTVRIDLEETTLSDRPYVRTDIQRSHSDWVTAKVSDDVFHASCGPLNLSEALRLFREWATSVSQER